MIRRMGGLHWLALFGAVLVSWTLVWTMSTPADVRALANVYGADFWRDLCAVGADGSGFFRLWLMWAIMSGAMMAPTALPSFATYDDLPDRGDKGPFSALVGGYLLIWFGAAALFAAAQIGLAGLNLTDPFGLSISIWLSSALLIVAGIYQFSAIKEACLAKCRMPLTFFMQFWGEGAFRMGLRLGAVCLGCCWALMALAFVGGVQSLAFMGLATVLMTLEKLPDLGRYLTKPLGFALIGAGAVFPFL